MISGDTIASTTGRLGIGLISAPLVAKAAAIVETTEKTIRFYEQPIAILGGLDGMGVSFIFGAIFMLQGIILRTIRIKKELQGEDTKEI